MYKDQFGEFIIFMWILGLKGFTSAHEGDALHSRVSLERARSFLYPITS